MEVSISYNICYQLSCYSRAVKLDVHILDTFWRIDFSVFKTQNLFLFTSINAFDFFFQFCKIFINLVII